MGEKKKLSELEAKENEIEKKLAEFKEATIKSFERDYLRQEISEAKGILKFKKENKAPGEQIQEMETRYQNLISEREKVRKRLRKFINNSGGGK